jgi:hypothetical protein
MCETNTIKKTSINDVTKGKVMTHESGGVVVPHGLGISKSFQDRISLNNLRSTSFYGDSSKKKLDHFKNKSVFIK